MAGLTSIFKQYRPVEKGDTSDDDSLLEGPAQNPLWKQSQRQKPSWSLLVSLCAGVGILSAFLGAAASWRYQTNTAYCTSVIAHKSPVIEDVGIRYHKVQFEGSFMHENIYRQKGSPEVDAAWEALGIDYRPVAVPEDQGIRAGIPKDQVKIADKYGGGFPANVEGLHHLHCLNLVRKGLWFNYDYYHNLGEGAFVNNDYVVRKHVTHCLDIVRQQLMCTVDVGVLGQVWWRNETMERAVPFVDFNTEHVCRNYDDIRRWAEERQLPIEAPEDFLEQPKEGDRVYPGIP